MGILYNNDLYNYQKWFSESAKLLGITVNYRYIIKRKTESQSGESIYSELSKPINIDVIIESGLPMIDSLKQLNWFVDTNDDSLLVSFPVDTPNLQEGCRFSFISKENKEQQKEYYIEKLTNTQLYPSCIKCLCKPILNTETVNIDDAIHYGQQDIASDEENYSFINESPKTTIF